MFRTSFGRNGLNKPGLFSNVKGRKEIEKVYFNNFGYGFMCFTYKAEIVMYDDKSFTVENVKGYDEKIELAVIETKASKTTPVTFAVDKPKTGETVYTLGSSKGLTGTFSDGIVSTASHIDGGVEYIQIAAPISSGNSGGPLVNVCGEKVITGDEGE